MEYKINNINHINFNNNTNEYTLKQNKFNPYKNSPNFFLTKLEFRMKNYFLEEELFSDNFNLSLENK